MLTNILDAKATQSDCAVVVLPVDTLTAENPWVVDLLASTSVPLIILTKMSALILEVIELMLTTN